MIAFNFCNSIINQTVDMHLTNRVRRFNNILCVQFEGKKTNVPYVPCTYMYLSSNRHRRICMSTEGVRQRFDLHFPGGYDCTCLAPPGEADVLPQSAAVAGQRDSARHAARGDIYLAWHCAESHVLSMSLFSILSSRSGEVLSSATFQTRSLQIHVHMVLHGRV